MKKFVSIVIALVMVLSMTSAFAWEVKCETRSYAWDCPTELNWCGKGKVEVVPFVKVNSTACAADGWKFVESDCAAAVNSTEVNYAIKLTFDAFPNMTWWNAAEITIKVDGIELPNTVNYKDAYTPSGTARKIKLDEELYPEEQVYYLLNDGSKWINEDDDAFDLKNVVVTAKVLEAEKAEVCATLISQNDGVGEYIWGDYYVFVDDEVEGYDYAIAFSDNAEYEKNVVVMLVKDGKVSAINADEASKKFYDAVNADFNLSACSIGTCVDADNIQNNFGWYDKLKDCLTWNTEASSTVNAECAVSVEIPKTGDVSVVAYAVMAIVAAAGTMLKK